MLCYHAVSDRWPADFAVTPAQLEYQLQHLLRRGYRGATFTAAVTGPPPGARSPSRSMTRFAPYWS